MSLLDKRERHTRDILARIEATETVSQRSLSRELGIALGLTNLLLRQLVRKGLVRLRRVKPNRVLYLITPAGIAEKTRLSHSYLRNSLASYTDARRRLQASFALLAEAHGMTRPVRVVFWGAGELAEIGYLCLQESGLSLVGVIDDSRQGRRFFGHAVRESSSLRGDRIGDEKFDVLVIVSLDEQAQIASRLGLTQVDAERVVWALTT